MKTRVRAERMSEAEGAALVSEWKNSGQTMAAFCRDRGLSAHRVSYWRRRLEESVSTGFMVASAGELRGTPAPADPSACIEVFVGERFRVRIPAQAGAVEDILFVLGAVAE